MYSRIKYAEKKYNWMRGLLDSVNIVFIEYDNNLTNLTPMWYNTQRLYIESAELWDT